jgi:hypothetical protein
MHFEFMSGRDEVDEEGTSGVFELLGIVWNFPKKE